jgi:hypothetical protein
MPVWFLAMQSQNDVYLGVRVPRKLRAALETERRRRGAKATLSEVVRGLLERALKKKAS